CPSPLLCSPSHLLPLVPLSFPTRRSSDLRPDQYPHTLRADLGGRHRNPLRTAPGGGASAALPQLARGRDHHRASARTVRAAGFRSEEHTSELQSRFDLVCRLLLEKKKIMK